MSHRRRRRKLRRYRWILLPFLLIWKLAGAIVSLTGRVLAMAIGTVLIVVGLLLSLTVIGAILGIPMMIIGALLLVRAFSIRR